MDDRLGPTLTQTARPSLEDSSTPWIVGPADDASVAIVIPASVRGISLVPESDRALALRQRTCPVTRELLGAHGRPLKITIGQRTVFVCCQGCLNDLKADPERYLAVK
jgi:hypothetical protein